jgi:uncharacterized protein (DUF1697 family)
MSTQIALLRAVNVGGTGKIPMTELRTLAESIGLTNVRSLLHSGNLVFDAGRRAPATTKTLLESACAESFGLKIDIYVRTPADLEHAIARNPLPKEARDDPARLHLLFLRDAPPASAFKALQAGIKGGELVHAGLHDAYLNYPEGVGNSKLTLGVIERVLGTTGTMRNWNTVSKLAALASE